MSSWRVPLRLALREAQRAKGRSILMLVMIALPVMGVTAADVLIATQNVNSVESLDRRLGTEAAAMAYVEGYGNLSVVHQGVDPESGGVEQGPTTKLRVPSFPRVLEVVGGHRTGAVVVATYPQLKTQLGLANITATELDPTDPLTHGLFRLTGGRWPRTADEVVVNKQLAGRGLGDVLTLVVTPSHGSTPAKTVTRTVVGYAESTSNRSSDELVALPGSLPVTSGDQVDTHWLIGGAPVTWTDVQRLNAIGVLVVSRSVILHPDAAARAADARLGNHVRIDHSVLTVGILAAVMALIEVVLLAGPAFAVGARRQARPLALMSACGGTPQQARRVILATGAVIGTVGAVAGGILGILGAKLVQPALQGHSYSWFGPFQILWAHLAGIALFGLVSALLAAVVPAWIASRQDVVAVLAGRRGDRKPSARSPYVGLVLIAVGVGLAVFGAKQSQLHTAIAIGLSAICCVLGMLFLVPVVIVGIARLGRRLPLPLRFAVRDAARHRTRTTPAVAAVAASVMGVVALSIGVSSSTAADKAAYVPSLPHGVAAITSWQPANGETPWAAYSRAVGQAAPGVTTVPIIGQPYETQAETSSSISFTHRNGIQVPLGPGHVSIGTDVLFADRTVPDVLGLTTAVRRQVSTALAAGKVVVFADRASPESTMLLRVEATGRASEHTRVTRTAVRAVVIAAHSPVSLTGIVPLRLARGLGLHPITVELVTSGPTITKSQESNLTEKLNAQSPGADVYVERGYQVPSRTWILQVILAALGALLMLGGTLTATFLALSDARPDLATLSAVGAAPRTRRAVAAAYALAVGGVGAVLGAVVGFVPGIAVTYPLTAAPIYDCGTGGCAKTTTTHFLDVPWPMIAGVVVLLPLVVAAVVWVCARSRLPLVSRLA